MAAKPDVTVVDSSALVSLANTVDSLHEEAMRIDQVLTADNWLILLPQEVLAETINAIGKKIGRAQALTFSHALLTRYNAHAFELLSPDRGVYDRALQYLGSGKGNPSFIDCLVMALADAQQTTTIFGFDSTFRKNGFNLPTRHDELRRAA